jgi:TetR/AcrR family transcriptional regulator of autoinduction and epiphytic fitness
MAMTEFLRDQELARRVFARAEMSNNPVRCIVSEAIDAGHLKDVDSNYATELLTAGAKAFFFWPKFLVGADSLDGASNVIEECVDMFLSRYQNESQS